MSVVQRVESFKRWVGGMALRTNRDASHGLVHFERVRLTALELANLSSSDGDALSEEESLVLQLAALSHDVLDHKYLKKDDDKAKADLEQEMRLALANSSGLTPKQVDDVCLISDNISLSKELSGLLEEGLLLERSLLRLRDCVSDADKLDALGACGIRRMAEYQLHRLMEDGLPLDMLTVELLQEMANAHLLHRVGYLRTPEAKMRGQGLLTETRAIIQSEEALRHIIAKVQYERGLQEDASRHRIS
jgi:HD superfamily phosphodiesterase